MRRTRIGGGLLVGWLVLPAIAACGDDEAGSGGGGGAGVTSSSSAATTTSATTAATTSTTASTTSSGSGGGGGEGGAPPLAITWEPCALDSTIPVGVDAECATVQVPLDWDDPTGETLGIFVKRWPVLAEPALHHFWTIQGGPGESGIGWESRLEAPAASFPDAQFYFRDPRGVGRSSRLECPEFETASSDGGFEVTLEEWPACIAAVQAERGESLAHFTTSQTAHDLGQLVEATRGDARVTILGASYGTTLLQRYLHFYPGQVEAVILDSLANPGFPFTDFALRANRVGHQYLDLCGEDPACAARVGADPSALADDTFAAQLDLGGCAGVVDAGFDRATLASYLAGLMGQPSLRASVLAVLHRLGRCNADDVEALVHLHDLFLAPSAPSLEERMWGWFLYHHIVFSEAWAEDSPTPEEYLIELASIEIGLYDVDLETLAPLWPVYGPEPLADVFPETTQPLLLANGTLDLQTPLEEALVARDHYTEPTQAFLVVPGTGHGAIGGEPWSLPSPPCTVQIIQAFVSDPATPVDAGCLDDIDPPSFELGPTESLVLLGTSDPWGDGPGLAPQEISPAAVEQARAAVARAIEAWRRGGR